MSNSLIVETLPVKQIPMTDEVKEALEVVREYLTDIRDTSGDGYLSSGANVLLHSDDKLLPFTIKLAAELLVKGQFVRPDRDLSWLKNS